MIISMSRRFIFIHIHKCAGDTVETACAPYLAVNDILNGAEASHEKARLTEMMLIGWSGPVAYKRA